MFEHFQELHLLEDEWEERREVEVRVVLLLQGHLDQAGRERTQSGVSHVLLYLGPDQYHQSEHQDSLSHTGYCPDRLYGV